MTSDVDTSAAAGGDRPGALSEDIGTADRILGPAYDQADQQAVRYQGRFRFAELAIIYGGVIAVILGTLAAYNHLFGFFGSVLTAALGSLAFISRGLGWHRRWLRQRLMAEMLSGERFLFLGRVGAYTDAADPARLLQRRVVEIKRLARVDADA